MSLHSGSMDVAPVAAAAVAEAERAEERIARYQAAFRAIAACPLNGLDFGDYVQSVIHDVLEGFAAECWKCGTEVHEGDCVDPDGDNAPLPAVAEAKQCRCGDAGACEICRRYLRYGCELVSEGWMNRPHAYHDPDTQQPTGCVCGRAECHRIHMGSPKLANLLGRLAYEVAASVSLAAGDDLPVWIDLRAAVREAWSDAAIENLSRNARI